MGNFYSNIVLHGSPRAAVISGLQAQRRRAFVSPETGTNVVVYDEDGEQRPRALFKLAKTLNKVLRVAAWAVVNHDDDVLMYRLYVSGECVDEYDSSPGYFGAREHADPEGGRAARLASAFDVPDQAQALAAILQRSSSADDAYVFEYERHTDLARLLRLPPDLVCSGFEYLSRGEFPHGTASDQFTRLGA